LRLVLNEVGLFLLAGIAAGVPATLAASRLVSGMVYGISEKDPVSIALTIATLTAVSICAAYLPARRAVNADPLSALRCE
jgi:ABC-type antimicrobial peptide transport system permease subunit